MAITPKPQEHPRAAEQGLEAAAAGAAASTTTATRAAADVNINRMGRKQQSNARRRTRDGVVGGSSAAAVWRRPHSKALLRQVCAHVDLAQKKLVAASSGL